LKKSIASFFLCFYYYSLPLNLTKKIERMSGKTLRSGKILSESKKSVSNTDIGEMSIEGHEKSIEKILNLSNVLLESVEVDHESKEKLAIDANIGEGKMDESMLRGFKRFESLPGDDLIEEIMEHQEMLRNIGVPDTIPRNLIYDLDNEQLSSLNKRLKSVLLEETRKVQPNQPIREERKKIWKHLKKPAPFDKGHKEFEEFTLSILPYVKTVTTFDEEQIALCVSYLEGKALKFSRRILYTPKGTRKTEIATFEQFWDLLREEFEDPKLVYRNTHLLRELRMKNSLEDYIDRFSELVYTLKHEDAENCELFRSKLPIWLRDKLVCFEETNLRELISKTREVDRHCRQIQKEKVRLTGQNGQLRTEREAKKNPSERSAILRCTFCDRTGHTANYCYDKKKNAGDFLTKNRKVNSMAIGHVDTDVSDIPEDEDDESDKDDEFLTEKISEQLSALRCGESSRDDYDSDDESDSQHIAALAEKRTFPNSWKRQNWILLFQDGNEVRNCLYKNTDGRFYISLEVKEGNDFISMLALVDSGATTSVVNRRMNGMNFLKKNVKAQMFDGTEADIQIAQDPTEIRFGPFTQKIWLTVCDKSCYDIVLGMD
jgi:Retrotransposon gag protein